MEADTLGCVGTTLKIINGKYFDFVNPNPSDLDLQSIATPLSRICRYGGHTPVFYSVAEHCYWTSYLAKIDEQPLDVQRAAFAHDWAEAICGDIPKPIKVLLGDAYAAIEESIEEAVCARFGVDIPGHYKTWKPLDLEMLVAERNAMWEDDGVHWKGSEFIKKRMVPFEFWDSLDAEAYFIDKAKELGIS